MKQVCAVRLATPFVCSFAPHIIGGRGHFKVEDARMLFKEKKDLVDSKEGAAGMTESTSGDHGL
jgi:hypothetical protein